VTLEGSSADIQKKLEANPKTKIPQILFTVYQHVFNSIYILASILNTPYPPPDLLHPMAEKIKILPSTPKPQPQPEQTAAPEPTPTPENPEPNLVRQAVFAERHALTHYIWSLIDVHCRKLWGRVLPDNGL
jgi:hypothetical protein